MTTKAAIWPARGRSLPMRDHRANNLNFFVHAPDVFDIECQVGTLDPFVEQTTLIQTLAELRLTGLQQYVALDIGRRRRGQAARRRISHLLSQTAHT